MNQQEIDALKILANYVHQLVVDKAKAQKVDPPADLTTMLNTINAMKPGPAPFTREDYQKELNEAMRNVRG